MAIEGYHPSILAACEISHIEESVILSGDEPQKTVPRQRKCCPCLRSGRQGPAVLFSLSRLRLRFGKLSFRRTCVRAKTPYREPGLFRSLARKQSFWELSRCIFIFLGTLQPSFSRNAFVLISNSLFEISATFQNAHSAGISGKKSSQRSAPILTG